MHRHQVSFVFDHDGLKRFGDVFAPVNRIFQFFKNGHPLDDFDGVFLFFEKAADGFAIQRVTTLFELIDMGCYDYPYITLFAFALLSMGTFTY